MSNNSFFPARKGGGRKLLSEKRIHSLVIMQTEKLNLLFAMSIGTEGDMLKINYLFISAIAFYYDMTAVITHQNLGN